MRIYIFFLWMLGAIIGLTSCNDDNDPVQPDSNTKRLKSIRYNGSDTHTLYLEYDKQGRLVQLTEAFSKPVITTLTYGDGEVLVERFGSYYGKFILNEQGYVSTFKRENTADYSYKYNAEGYLIESTNGKRTNTYTFKNNNLASYETSSSFGQLTASDTKDMLKAPAFYQPHYLHILGNVEVKIGYLAGFYGKHSTHLALSTDYTVEKGKEWESQIIIEYTYKLDEDGYVTQQIESGASYYYNNGTKYQKASSNTSMFFSYED